MRNFIILVTFVLFVGCSANDLTFHKISGKNINDLSGKWTVINYWADWCPPCIKEIPELHELDKNFEKIQVFLFNFDRLQGDELEEQLMRFNVSLPSLITDPSNFFDIDVPDALPVSFIIDPNLSLSLTLKGPQTEESILEAIKYSE